MYKGISVTIPSGLFIPLGIIVCEQTFSSHRKCQNWVNNMAISLGKPTYRSPAIIRQWIDKGYILEPSGKRISDTSHLLKANTANGYKAQTDGIKDKFLTEGITDLMRDHMVSQAIQNGLDYQKPIEVRDLMDNVTVYDSVMDFCHKNNMDQGTVWCWCNKKYTPTGKYLGYKFDYC